MSDAWERGKWNVRLGVWMDGVCGEVSRTVRKLLLEFVLEDGGVPFAAAGPGEEG